MVHSTPLFDYHIGWKSRGKRPGRHKSNQRGMGIEFAGHTTLLSYPDPRRIDIRQSIRDPLGEIHVKIFNQRSATPVMIICDLSASMNFGGKLQDRHHGEMGPGLGSAAGALPAPGLLPRDRLRGRWPLRRLTRLRRGHSGLDRPDERQR